MNDELFYHATELREALWSAAACRRFCTARLVELLSASRKIDPLFDNQNVNQS